MAGTKPDNMRIGSGTSGSGKILAANRLVLLVAVPLFLVLALVAYLTIQFAINERDAQGWVRHTYQVIGKLEPDPRTISRSPRRASAAILLTRDQAIPGALSGRPRPGDGRSRHVPPVDRRQSRPAAPRRRDCSSWSMNASLRLRRHPAASWGYAGRPQRRTGARPPADGRAARGDRRRAWRKNGACWHSATVSAAKPRIWKSPSPSAPAC